MLEGSQDIRRVSKTRTPSDRTPLLKANHLHRRSNRWSAWFVLLLIPLAPQPAPAQVEEAREAIAREDFQGAVGILAPVVADNPTPDAYLYLGLAHANLTQYDRALELFDEASDRYPDDPRFHSETAGVHLANRDVEQAIDALHRALAVDPDDAYASDLLASVQLSEGEVGEALGTWNQVGQPRIGEITQNFSPGLLHWTVPHSLAFGQGDVLTYSKWRTTQSRLFGSRLFSNVGLELEPSGAGNLYDAIVRTSPRTNTPTDILIDLVRELPAESTNLEIWDAAGSGISWKSNFRWDEDRRRLRGQLLVPLPLPGLPFIEFQDVWRSERWDLSPAIRDEFLPQAEFDYKVNSVGLDFKAIPHHQIEINAGLEYRNRAASGRIAALGMDERNSGTFTFGAIVRPVDGRYKNQLRINAFVARRSVLGDFDFSGGSLEFANRFLIQEGSTTVFDWSVTGGTSRGNLPVDHYFILGLGSVAQHRLRAHVASDQGRYGRAPMGTDFILLNTDIERRLATIPLFNTFSIPFLEIKAIGFFDSAKTFDRQRIFRQGEWLNDVGAGLRFETPTAAFTVLYGRDVHGGENSFYGYVEQRFW